MAKIVEEFEIKGDSKSAQKASRDTEKSLTGAFIKGQLAVQAFNKAFGFFTDSLKQGFTDAFKFEQTTIKLDIALKKIGNTSANTRKMFNEAAAEMQQMTGVSDEVFRGMQSMALEMGVATGKVNEFVRAAQLMSIQSGGSMSPEGAMRQLIKTLSGLQGEIGEALPFIKELTKEELKQGKAIDVINDKWGDLIDLQTRGGAGEMAKLSSAWADFNEQLALFLINATPLIEALGGVAKQLGLITELVSRQEYVAATVAAVAPLVPGGGELLGEMQDRLDQLREDTADYEMELVSLVSAPAGKGAGGGKGGGGPLVAFEGPVGAAWQDFQSQEQIERQRAEIYASGREQIEQMHLLHLENLNAQETAYLENEYTQNQQKMVDITMRATSAIGNMGGQMFAAWLAGQKVTAKEFIANTMKIMGQIVMSKGVADLAMASASALIPGQQYAAGAIPLALSEIAMGAAMMAGGTLLNKGAGKAGGGGASGAAGRFTSGAGGGGGGGVAPSEPKTVIINVNGAVTDAGVGVQIMKSLEEARRQGLVV